MISTLALRKLCDYKQPLYRGGKGTSVLICLLKFSLSGRAASKTLFPSLLELCSLV